MNIKELIQAYIEADAEYKLSKAIREELSKAIIEVCNKFDMDYITHSVSDRHTVKVQRVHSHSWKYDSATKKQLERIKEYAQQHGGAVKNPYSYLKILDE
jgi:GTP1/Obg family GTP-binding protein